MRIARSSRLRHIAAGVFLLAAGCSVVNAFDDVTPEPAGTYTPGASPTSTRVDSAVPGSESGSDGTAPRPGVIVVGGEVLGDAGRAFVLTVLDPVDGHEIDRARRELMTVSAVRYDGLRDLWYIFEASGEDFVVGTSDTMTLHVRSLDTGTGAWTELSTLSVPPLQSYDSIGVVRDRLGYVAYAQDDAAPSAVQFVTLDTTDPSAPSILSRLPLPRAPLGATESRSVTGPGGVVNLVQLNAQACDGAICPIELVSVRIPNGTAPILDPPVGVAGATRFATPSYGTFRAADRTLVVAPRTSNDPLATTSLSLVEPRTKDTDGVPATTIIKDTVLRRAAVADCARVAFVVGANSDLDLHAVPMPVAGGGTPTRATLGHSGQSVYFEPTTSTVIAPFNQGAGFDFTAFRLDGPADAPTLTKRGAPDWEPPADLRPNLLEVRLPLPVVCN